MIRRSRTTARLRPAVLTAAVQVPQPPRAVFFIHKKERAAGECPVEDVTRRVAQLAIAPAGNGTHYLRRLDADGRLVWQTLHLSRRETLWRAEWEYDLKESDWKKRETRVSPDARKPKPEAGGPS